MASPIQLKNNAVGRLTSGVSSLATTLILVSGDGAKFPTLTGTQYFPAALIRASDSAVEIVKVTARSGDVLTVVRAQEGTSGLVLLAGDRVELRFTAGTLTDEVARIEAIAQDAEDAASDAAAAAAAAQSTANSALSLASAAAPDTSVVKLTGAQTVAGVKTFSSAPIIPDGAAADEPATKGQLDAQIAAVTALARSPARQTVLSGPVDSSGLPAFGGSTGSTTVTATGTLIASAANGWGTSGVVDRIGSITNPSWTGLSTNGTMYLYLDIAANGTCTPGSTTLAPTYQRGGTYSTTNGQFTFDTSEMVGKVGDGSAANQTYRVFVGQVTVSGNVVTAITWYALRGLYESPWFAVAASTAYARSHNLGVMPSDYRVLFSESSTGSNARRPLERGTSTALGYYLAAVSNTALTLNTSQYVALSVTDSALTSGYYKLICERGW